MRRFLSTWAGAFLLAVGWVLWQLQIRPAAEMILTLCIITAGWPVARHGLRNMAKGSFDIDSLVTVAAVAAPFIGEWVEGGLVIVLFSISHALEEAVTERNRRSIAALVKATPRQARVLEEGEEVQREADSLRPGEVFALRPGDRAPADGQVIGGASGMDESPITGEPFPVPKETGSQVYAGAINREGYLEVRVTRPPAQSTLARMIALVEQAERARAPAQRLVDRFARYYTPAVLVAAAGLALMPLAARLSGSPVTIGIWVYRALALLLIACPCALVISTPAAIVAGIANAARHGVLVKGGAHLETLGRIRAFAFDKTGTLTYGLPQVAAVSATDGATEEEVLRLAAAVESHSEHPLARAVCTEAERWRLQLPEVTDFRAYPGLGAEARVNGMVYRVGNPRLFASATWPGSLSQEVARARERGETVVLVGNARTVTGAITLADQVRAGSRQMVDGLRHLGVSEVVVLSGDHEASVRAVAARLGIGSVRAELLPEQKVEVVRELRSRFGAVAMVGDGINDAPALAVSSLGVAMGAAGSDAALETADVALMGDDLRRLPYAVALGRRALAVVRQNVALAVGIKLLALVLLALGRLELWMAVLSDSGTAVLVTLNSMRLLGLRPGGSTGVTLETAARSLDGAESM